jgi:hypothetical protein
MKKTTKLKKYVELFKRNISQFVPSGVDIKSTIYPVESDGAVFEFLFNKNKESSNVLENIRPTVGRVLSEIPQRLVGGNIENVQFKGTNLYLEGSRILIIKGEDDPSSWSGNAVMDDVKRVVSTSQGGKTA